MSKYYVIKMTRHYYGPTRESSLVQSPDTGKAALYTTVAAAREDIANFEREAYTTEHNESGAPTYQVLSRDRIPEYLQAWL